MSSLGHTCAQMDRSSIAATQCSAAHYDTSIASSQQTILRLTGISPVAVLALVGRGARALGDIHMVPERAPLTWHAHTVWIVVLIHFGAWHSVPMEFLQQHRAVCLLGKSERNEWTTWQYALGLNMAHYAQCPGRILGLPDRSSHQSWAACNGGLERTNGSAERLA